MKYLKRFNEELKTSTYIRASDKLKKMGHVNRSNKLKEWSVDSKKIKDIKDMNSMIEKYSKYGTYTFNIGESKTPIDFHIFLYFDDNMNEYVGLDEGDTFNIFFQLGLIPVDVENMEKLVNSLSYVNIYNGAFCDTYLDLSFKYDGSNISMIDVKIELGGEEELVSITDRRTAVRLKNLLISIFNESSDYPCEDSYDKLVDKISKSLIIDSNYAFEHGLEIEDISIMLKGISVNKLYLD